MSGPGLAGVFYDEIMAAAELQIRTFIMLVKGIHSESGIQNQYFFPLCAIVRDERQAFWSNRGPSGVVRIDQEQGVEAQDIKQAEQFLGIEGALQVRFVQGL